MVGEGEWLSQGLRRKRYGKGVGFWDKRPNPSTKSSQEVRECPWDSLDPTKGFLYIKLENNSTSFKFPVKFLTYMKLLWMTCFLMKPLHALDTFLFFVFHIVRHYQACCTHHAPKRQDSEIAKSQTRIT
jgi:hypothetical protein